jgi:hypothetical protein
LTIGGIGAGWLRSKFSEIGYNKNFFKWKIT